LSPELKAELVDLLAEAVVADLFKYPTVESLKGLDHKKVLKKLLPEAGLDGKESAVVTRS